MPNIIYYSQYVKIPTDTNMRLLIPEIQFYAAIIKDEVLTHSLT